MAVYACFDAREFKTGSEYIGEGKIGSVGTLRKMVICVTPQDPLQGRDGHFTPQTQRLKV